MWYDVGRLLSYNPVFGFVIGNRGGGKTYNTKRWAIRDFIKNGKQFVIVRRYKEELKKCKLFFDDIKHEFPNHKFEVKGRTAFINDKVCGYFIPLSTSQKEKSTAYPLVNKIIFDEFLIDKKNSRYLNNEVDIFLDLFETINRTRDDTRAIFLGNNISLVNPYFTYFKIRPNLNERFSVFRDGSLVVEMFKDADFIEMKQKSRFGRLLSGTHYAEYAIENQTLRDNDNFILKKKPQKSVYMYSMKIDGVDYGLWYCEKEGIIYINNQIDTFKPVKYVLTKDDHEPNYLLLRTAKKTNDIQQFLYAFEMGLIRFNNIVTKNAFYEAKGLF